MSLLITIDYEGKKNGDGLSLLHAAFRPHFPSNPTKWKRDSKFQEKKPYSTEQQSEQKNKANFWKNVNDFNAQNVKRTYWKGEWIKQLHAVPFHDIREITGKKISNFGQHNQVLRTRHIHRSNKPLTLLSNTEFLPPDVRIGISYKKQT